MTDLLVGSQINFVFFPQKSVVFKKCSGIFVITKNFGKEEWFYHIPGVKKPHDFAKSLVLQTKQKNY